MLERQPSQNLFPQFEETVDKTATPHYLITMDVGIGDAVAIGLSAVDQIIRNDPAAYGNIDVLCNKLQAEIFAYDPRISRIIATNITFFPSLDPTTWLKTIFLDGARASMTHFLREQHYKGVFPSIVAPGLYLGLHSHIMLPNILKLMRDMLLQHHPANTSLRTLARQMVNRSFGNNIPDAALEEEEVLLYLGSREIGKARMTATMIKEALPFDGDSRLLVIAPDSASTVTRPPTELLAAALADALEECPNLIVSILPGYTDVSASENLRSALASHFDDHIFLLPAKPRASLLETAAFLDQADILVTGDTGIMHLAAANKKLEPGEDIRFRPRNRLKIIALFGGTNPTYYGYKKRTIIVGSGRKEQMAFRPGFSKESYNTHGRNFFDHIAPRELTEAIINQADLLQGPLQL
jgi:hypothetical protein